VSKPPTETTAEAALHHTAAPSLAHRRELAHRLSGVVEVTLYWSADDDSTGVGGLATRIRTSAALQSPTRACARRLLPPLQPPNSGRRERWNVRS
jgi:hypothetical protein